MPRNHLPSNFPGNIRYATNEQLTRIAKQLLTDNGTRAPQRKSVILGSVLCATVIGLPVGVPLLIVSAYKVHKEVLKIQETLQSLRAVQELTDDDGPLHLRYNYETTHIGLTNRGRTSTGLRQLELNIGSFERDNVVVPPTASALYSRPELVELSLPPTATRNPAWPPPYTPTADLTLTDVL